ncbi:MAG: SDR family oxidoreductase [Clostridium sp.]|nr:SDR family oxidoreductase [Clostridium sp.]MCM1560260.1 SDR family oxidoreductase [Butyrivibrio sp.]
MNYNFESLKDKNVLVTGGSGAIGLAIARGFKECGSRVYLWGHRKIDNAEEFDHYQIVELTKEQEIRDQFLKIHEMMDVLVNCAGFTMGEKSEKYPMDMWQKTMAINVTAPFLLSQLVAEHMMQKGEGSIINITSIGAEMGFPHNPAYGVSKGGLKQLTKALACDWAEYGIRVNNVGPGYTKTKMTNGSWCDEEKRKERTERMMLKHWAEPEDIVGIVLFLASDMAKYITGQDIYVDGGWTAKGM